jgi:hypothetical protein
VTQTTDDNSAASSTPPKKAGKRRGRMAFGLSVLALLLSVVSIAVSLLALTTARSDESATPAPQESAGTPSAANTIPVESNSPSENASGKGTSQPPASDAPLPTAAANYTVSYEDRRLTLQPNGENCGGAARVVDLDQPAINVPTGGDLEYQPTYRCEGTPSLQFVSDKVATVVSSTATPQDCAQAIQLSPASQQIAPSQDLVICAVTDGQGAANEPIRGKITRMVVTGVGQEQKVALNVTAWEIPY